VTVEKDLGDTFKGVLWKSPEWTIQSPAYELPGDIGNVSFTGIWGSYETRAFDGNDEVSVDRIAFLADLEGSATIGDLRPFWGARYWHHRYDDPSVTQERTRVWIGVEWPLGDIDMVSRWSRNWVDGRSPMAWDRYSDSEAFYQTVSLSLTERWRFSARGGYNVGTDELDEMFYRLVYDNNCCYSVQLRFRDDRTVSDDDQAELRFVLTAFPSHPFFLGESD
jgi:LPS-assembly protein